jgi:uncharacterized membrane protein
MSPLILIIEPCCLVLTANYAPLEGCDYCLLLVLVVLGAFSLVSQFPKSAYSSLAVSISFSLVAGLLSLKSYSS